MANNQSNASVKCEVTWQISLKWGGQYHTSPVYKSEEECVKNLLPFMRQFQGKFLVPTLVRNVRYIEQQ